MIDAAVLDVLARATEIGLPEHAATLTIIYDPFLRPAIRRRLEAAIAEAGKRTIRPLPGASEHVLRLAFLLAHPTKPPISDPNDERAVERLFDELSAPYLPPKPKLPEGGAYRGAAIKLEPSELVAALPKRSWPITRAVTASVTLVILSIAGIVFVPYFIPTPKERFAKTPLGAALGDPLTEVVAAAPPNGMQARYDVARLAFAAAPVKKQLGSAAPLLERVLDLHLEATGNDDSFPPLEKAIEDANRAFAAAHIPAHVHGWARSSAVWLLGYYVDERAIDTVGNTKMPVVWGRRLDRLNFDDSPLWKSNLEEDVIVSMPKMEEVLVQSLLPTLAQNKPLLADSEDAPLTSLARTAADIVRAEIAHALHFTEKDASKLADTIAARNASLDELAGHGWRLHATSQLWLTPTELADVTIAERQGDLAASSLASDALSRNTQMKLVAKPALPLLAEITRWEEEAFVGRLAEEPSAPSSDMATVAGELATIARPRALPKTALWLALRPLLSFDRRGSAGVANATVLRKVFEAAGLDPGTTDAGSPAFLAAATKLVQLPPDKTQAAAARAYGELFGHPVPTFTRQTQ